MRVSTDEDKQRWRGWGERLLMGDQPDPRGFPGLEQGATAVWCSLPGKADLLLTQAEKLLARMKLKQIRKAKRQAKKRAKQEAERALEEMSQRFQFDRHQADVGAHVEFNNHIYEDRRMLQETALPDRERRRRRLERFRQQRVEDQEVAVAEHIAYPVSGRTILPKRVPWVE